MMNNKLFIRVIALIMAFAMIMAMVGCGGDSKDPQPSQDTTQPSQETTQPSILPDSRYTVKVINQAGKGMEKCAVDVYTDATKTTHIFRGITNKDGIVVFAAPVSSDYVAVLSKVPEFYQLETQYAITGATTNIALKAGVMDEYAMENLKFSLGDPMMDFTLTLPDKSEVVLSDLLKDKKAVVLNFWFMNCAPCRGEFPYIQEGFEQVSEDVAVLALNPIDGTADEVSKFQSDNGYTFTMSKCDPRWANMLKLQYYPTTLVIDRYGYICLVHTGGLTNTQEFLDMVNYFTGDDYEQKFFRSLGQIPKTE